MGVYFVACTLWVICLLHEGRSRADQCDQDTRLASIVGKNKEKNMDTNSKKCEDRKLRIEDIANSLY